jgi:hypothetical protein
MSYRTTCPRSKAQSEGVKALFRLYPVALGDAGQCRFIARFLAGLYNGEQFAFDLTDLRALDDALFEDCMLVLRMDARACQQEIHTYFPEGSTKWQTMIEDRGMVRVWSLKNVAKEILDRPACLTDARLLADLRTAMCREGDAS